MIRMISICATAMAISASALGQQAAGSQQAQALEKTVTKTLKAQYLLYLPKDYGKEADKKWPLVLFLHGSGESGSDVEKVKVHGPPKLVAAGKEFPFILVSPQSPGGGWNTEVLGALLDEIEAKYAVDRDRVYCTGLSMGGAGTWDLAMAYPDRFAAIAPMGAGGYARRVRRLRNVPAWVFYGAKDNAAGLKESGEMVQALTEAGGEAKLTVYPDAGHDCWTEAYNTAELYDWLLKHKRASKKEGVP